MPERPGGKQMGTTSSGALSSGANYGNTGKDYGPYSKGPPHQPSSTSGNGTKTTTKTTTKTDKPRFVPSIAYNVWQGVKKWSRAQNLEKRTKFAQDEGLNREWAMSQQGLYNTKSHHGIKSTGSPLDVMSTQGKDYLKEAGYGPFQDKKSTGGGEGQQRCPDGSMPPCPPVATQAPATPTTPTNTGWQFYPTNSNYLTGEGYDEGGGVKFGPPPKKGPNPQVPPVKFSRGGGCAVRGTKFSGVK